MSQQNLSQQQIIDLTSSPQGLQIIHFPNGEFITLHLSNSSTTYNIWAKPRIDGAQPTPIASISFNRAFPKLRPVHLQAILDFIHNNFPNSDDEP